MPKGDWYHGYYDGVRWPVKRVAQGDGLQKITKIIRQPGHEEIQKPERHPKGVFHNNKSKG